MFNIGQDYAQRLRKNKNQLYKDLKPKDRICKIITNYFLPNLGVDGFKFVKSRMQLERTLGDFKQIVWFRTSIQNYKDEVVNFEVYLKVENEDYQRHCNDKYNYRIDDFISEQVKYLKL